MNINLQRLFQGLLWFFQGVNMLDDIISPKWKPVVALGIQAASWIIGDVAQKLDVKGNSLKKLAENREIANAG